MMQHVIKNKLYLCECVDQFSEEQTETHSIHLILPEQSDLTVVFITIPKQWMWSTAREGSRNVDVLLRFAVVFGVTVVHYWKEKPNAGCLALQAVVKIMYLICTFEIQLCNDKE